MPALPCTTTGPPAPTGTYLGFGANLPLRWPAAENRVA